MSTRERFVQFAVSSDAGEISDDHANVVPERMIGSGHIMSWVGIAAALWSLIAFSAFAI